MKYLAQKLQRERYFKRVIFNGSIITDIVKWIIKDDRISGSDGKRPNCRKCEAYKAGNGKNNVYRNGKTGSGMRMSNGWEQKEHSETVTRICYRGARRIAK